MAVKAYVEKYKQYVIDLRREFHMYPETKWQERRTSQRVREELDKMAIPYIMAAELGIVAMIRGHQEGKTIGLRADMDALQVQELNDIPYKSKHEGIMHACGHDGHTAMLLGAAAVLNDMRSEIKGTIKLIFQPAEEGAEGGKRMLDEGIMAGIDEVFAIHLWADIPCGTVSVDAGPRMASADYFKITVKGRGGHGSMPHQGVDAIVAASAIIMDIQSVVSREISPLESAVVSIGSFHAGTSFNVIASEAVLEGTTRCFNPEVRRALPEVLERIVRHTADSYRATGTLEYIPMTPPVINDAAASRRAEVAITKLFGREAIYSFDKIMGAEDYAYYLEKAPGIIAFVGAGNKEKGASYPHHHGKFNIDEDALAIGTALHVQYALDFLSKGE